jgi:hypothetical protein
MAALPVPPLHALFQRRIDGDDALLRLARLRFEQAGLAAEAYAGSPEELEGLLAFTPSGARLPTVHLSRRIDVLRSADRHAVAAFARRIGDRVTGFVVHDRAHMPGRLDELELAANELSDTLERSGPARLFIEYAAGTEVADFIELGRRLAGVERVGVCLDTGHVGIRAARRHFARERPDVGDDLVALDPDDPRLPGLAADVQAAVGAGLTAVLELTIALADQGKPVHYHLHDGHPLVRGLADHLSFLTRVPVPFEYQGRRSLDPLYGPTGLAAIVRTAAQMYGPERVSFTLEIHEGEGRLPLGDAAPLFRHWRDLTNAERMNAWLEVLAQNATLVRSALSHAQS